jgi:hypothetical protein
MVYSQSKLAKTATNKQETELKNKLSRLTKEQVICSTCLILALFATCMSLGGYTFANIQLERFSIVILALLLVFVGVVVSMGPKSTMRTISLVLAIPLAVFASLGACVGANSLDERPDGVALVAQVGDVTFELVTAYDVTYYDICKQCRELRMKRSVLNGILEQRETLISVLPAFSAKAELIDNGKKIRFSSPALLGRKAIVRTFSTDWEKARKNGLEQIQLTPAEQIASSI